MSLGLVGPSGGDLDLLDRALTLLAGPAGCERVYLLGDRPGTLEDLLRRRGAGDTDSGDDLAEMVAAFVGAEPDESRTDAGARAAAVYGAPVIEVPDSQAASEDRLIDLWHGRIVVATADKERLSRDDIANASIVLHGDGERAAHAVFGPRLFVTPGPLAAQRTVATLGLEGGQMLFEVLELDGRTVERHEVKLRRTTKMRVV